MVAAADFNGGDRHMRKLRNTTRVICGAAMALAMLASAGSAEAQGRGNSHGTPPGLAKKGGLPPGQAKKIYRPDDGVVVMRDIFGRYGYTVVRVDPYGTSRYVYYRKGPRGRVYRATVRPGTEQLLFQNVPEVVLREVINRLYY
jgi:hypothetical protein